MANDIISLANEIAKEKENIRAAIVAAGVACDERTPLSEYASKISSIQNRISEEGTDIFYKNSDSTLTQKATSYTLTANYAVVNDNAFSGLQKLQTVTLPNVTAVMNGAFANCKELTKINAPMCKWFGDSALTNAKLTQDYINDTVEHFGNCCFINNDNIQNISLTSALYLGTSCFEGCTKARTVNIPKVKYIGNRCFYNFGNDVYEGPVLQKWDLDAKNVEEIGSYACYSNKALQNINAPKVKKLGDFCFDGTALNNIYMPELEVVGKNCFAATTISGEVTLPNIVSIGESAFSTTNMFQDKDIVLSNCIYVGSYGLAVEVSTSDYTNSYQTLTVADGCHFGSNALTKQQQSTTGSSSHKLQYIYGKIGYLGMYALNHITNLKSADFSECVYIGKQAFTGSNTVWEADIDLSKCTKIEDQGLWAIGYQSNSHPIKMWLPSTCVLATTNSLGNGRANVHIFTDSATKPNNLGSGYTNFTLNATYEDFLNA